SLKRLLQGAAAGAVATIVVGFSWGGWSLGSTAQRLAADQASTAVVAVLTPICVEKFLQNSDAQANLAALREISSTGKVSGEGRLGDTAGSYLLRLRAGQGVCGEIDRSQSCVPMRSIAPRGSGHT